MSSQTAIVNWAITKAAGQRVSNINDDTPAGRVMSALYEIVRDAEVKRCRWKFAIKRDQWMADTNLPTNSWGYTYAYTLPPAYLGLIQAGEFYVRPMSKVQGPWTVEDGKLLTDLQAPLRVRYIQRVTDAAKFDPLFVEVLACKLALEGSKTLKQNEQKQSALRDEYKEALFEAARADSLEVPADEFPWGTWLESREGDFGSLTGST